MSNNKTEYHIYSHHNPTIQTMGDFVSETDSIGIGLNISELLIYQDENNNFNLDNLINLYSKDELSQFKNLIDQIRNNKPVQNKIITTSSDNKILIDASANNSKPIVTIKDAAKLNQLIYQGDTSYLLHNFTGNNLTKINSLYSQESRLLFKKFIFRIENETDYSVIIIDSIRNQAEQNKQLSLGNSNSNFSYHMVGLAIDIKLVNKLDNTIELNKKSDPKDWIKAGIIKISDDLNLNWGGRFKNVNSDPVHFDAKNLFTVDKDRFFESESSNKTIVTDTNNTSDTSNNDAYLDLPIKIGTVLAIPLSKVDRDVLTTETNQAINTTDFGSFLAKKLFDLLNDKGYKRAFLPKASTEFKGSVKEIYPYISVWVWSRALSLTDFSDNTYDHKILNITPYISSLNTNNGDNGGSFSISLSSLTADIVNQNWLIKKGTQQSSKKNKSDYVNNSYFHYVEDGQLKRERMYFEKVLQANDLVFIRFEKLELEDNRANLDDLETISIDELPNQIFDMIALIDDVSIDNVYSSGDSNVNVGGRDLIKLLIEDGVYFYPTEFTADGIFANSGATNSRLKRFGANGEYLSRFQTANKSVERSLKFIINNLGAIEICPTDLFNGYGNTLIDKSSSKTIDNRSRAFSLQDANNSSDSEQDQNINDNKDSILENIDSIRSNNKVDKGSSIEVFNIIKNFISERILNDEIVIQSQKIKSWSNSEKNKLVENKIPSDLIGLLFEAERVWIDKKDRNIQTALILNNPASLLESLYIKTDKKKLALVSLPLFKTLSTSQVDSSKKTKYYENKISFSNILIEINTYLNEALKQPFYDDIISQVIFDLADTERLSQAYNSTLAKGDLINLGILSKTIEDLTDNEKSIFDDIYNLLITENSKLIKPSQKITAPLLAGIWQIIKLVIDDSVKDRRLTDASIGNENGSLLNAFRKICQEPFCEFFTDTYGDQFYFIARKKPFDKEGVLSMIEGRAVFEVTDPVDDSVAEESDKFAKVYSNPKLIVKSSTVTKQDLIIDIEEDDIISDNIKTATEAYSWYKLQLSNLTTGSASDMAFAYLKAIYFDEFADIFGSKPLDLTTSYIPYSPIIDKNIKLPTAYFIKQGVYDLKYMIESHAYLPFTRMGTIVMNGDRRIKKGTFVRLKGTGEIGYVDGVANAYSIDDSKIDRTTTLQVSRLMIEKYIKGVDFAISSVPSFTSNDPLDKFISPANLNKNKNSSKINISYFNICNLPIDESVFSNSEAGFSAFSKASTANWKVNKTVFNFFLKKLQFSKNEKEISMDGITFFEK